MASTNNTDIRTGMSPQKRAWLSIHRHIFLTFMREEDEMIEASNLLLSYGEHSIPQKHAHKFMVAKKAFWICCFNGDKEGCYKWYEKAKKRGLDSMEAVGDLTDQERILCVSHHEETRDVLSEEGQDNAYMKAGKSVKNGVDNMEYVLKNMPN